MIKTLFSEFSLIELRMETCGYVNKSIRKDIKAMKEFMSSQNIPFLSLNQFSCLNEYDIFLVAESPKNNSIYTDFSFHKHAYLTFVNTKIMREFEPIVVTEECPSFPFLEIKSTRFRKMEIYCGNEDMDVGARSIQGNLALILQNCMDNVKGVSLISPFRHFGEIKVKKGYEKIMKNTVQFLPDFIEFSKTMNSEDVKEENEMDNMLRYTNFSRIMNLKLNDRRDFLEMKECLESDYRDIKNMKKSEWFRLAEDEDKNRARWFFNLMKLIDLK